jgi:hypothetical protein
MQDRVDQVKEVARQIHRAKEEAANQVAQIVLGLLVDCNLVTSPSARRDVLEEKLTELFEEEL